MVFAFENRSGQKLQEYMRTGAALAVAEKLEAEKSFITLNGPLGLTPEQVNLPPGPDGLKRANEIAKSKGATHFLTGWFSGKTYKWRLAAEVYAVGQEPLLMGSARRDGTQHGWFKTRKGRTVLIVLMELIQGMLADVIEESFAKAKLGLSVPARASLRKPITPDNWAFQKLAQAFDAYLGTERGPNNKTDIAVAEYAVRIDPKCVEAQRLYAHMLERDGSPIKAVIHYEVAAAERPDDIRTLKALVNAETGLNHFETAESWAMKATAARPKDATLRRMLAKTKLNLNKPREAMIELEKSRDLDPNDAGARRELAGIYSSFRRHLDAAAELSAAVNLDRANSESFYLLAASWRAGGRRDRAKESYLEAIDRFPREAGFRKFLADLLCAEGEKGACADEYRRALVLSPSDSRLAAAVAGSGSPYPGGEELLKSLASGLESLAGADRNRDLCRMSMNDALLEMSWRGKKACSEGGRAGASMRLAKSAGNRYLAYAKSLTATSAAIKAALANGEGKFLTPVENDDAEQMMGASGKVPADTAELRSISGKQAAALAAKLGCTEGTAGATADEVNRRNLNREVSLPEVLPPKWMLAITPDVPVRLDRPVPFTVDNSAGAAAQTVTLDGQVIGGVPAGGSTDFTAPLGWHKLCLTIGKARCGEQSTVRRVFIHYGWTITVRK
jgi:tetratricopeptide (TPR) repeat protein